MNNDLYTGFVCDRARELGVLLGKIAAASRRVSVQLANTEKRKHPKSGLPRIYVTNVSYEVLDAIILDQPIPRIVTETQSSIVDELKAIVSTLNNMADVIAAKDREIELMRREMARLSAAARRAMAVYGD